jgi:hypothetical protein
MEITKFELKEGINAGAHRKNKHFTDEIVVLDLESNVDMPIFIIRFYNTPSSTYCCIWSHKGKYFNGSAKSYEEFESLKSALKSCGIEFDKYQRGFGGGYDAILILIANKLGYNNIYIHHSHA